MNVLALGVHLIALDDLLVGDLLAVGLGDPLVPNAGQLSLAGFRESSPTCGTRRCTASHRHVQQPEADRSAPNRPCRSSSSACQLCLPSLVPAAHGRILRTPPARWPRAATRPYLRRDRAAGGASDSRCSNGEFVPPLLRGRARGDPPARLACGENARSVGMSRRKFPVHGLGRGRHPADPPGMPRRLADLVGVATTPCPGGRQGPGCGGAGRRGVHLRRPGAPPRVRPDALDARGAVLRLGVPPGGTAARTIPAPALRARFSWRTSSAQRHEHDLSALPIAERQSALGGDHGGDPPDGPSPPAAGTRSCAQALPSHGPLEANLEEVNAGSSRSPRGRCCAFGDPATPGGSTTRPRPAPGRLRSIHRQGARASDQDHLCPQGVRGGEPEMCPVPPATPPTSTSIVYHSGLVELRREDPARRDQGVNCLITATKARCGGWRQQVPRGARLDLVDDHGDLMVPASHLLGNFFRYVGEDNGRLGNRLHSSTAPPRTRSRLSARSRSRRSSRSRRTIPGAEPDARRRSSAATAPASTDSEPRNRYCEFTRRQLEEIRRQIVLQTATYGPRNAAEVAWVRAHHQGWPGPVGPPASRSARAAPACPGRAACRSRQGRTAGRCAKPRAPCRRSRWSRRRASR